MTLTEPQAHVRTETVETVGDLVDSMYDLMIRMLDGQRMLTKSWVSAWGPSTNGTNGSSH